MRLATRVSPAPANLRNKTMTTTNTVSKSINGVAVDDLSATVEAVKANASIAKFKFRVRNQWEDGAKNRSTANDLYGPGEEHANEAAFVLETE